MAFAFRSRSARVRSPLAWRVVYGAVRSGAGVRLAALACRVLAAALRTAPQVVADKALGLFEVGWPHHLGTPWVNLEVQRFHRRIVRVLNGDRPRPQRAPRAELARVGVLARLEDAFFFTAPFFRAAPVEVAAFDFGSASPVAGRWLERYAHFSLAQVDELAAAVERADLDLLLVDVKKPGLVHALFDRIDVPCIAIMCAEVHLRYHPSVSFHLYPFQQADYLLRDDRLWCATSRTFFGGEVVYPAHFAYDRRGLDPTARRPWSEREPLIVYHGRLFKLSDAFLAVVLPLLADDEQLELALVGADTHGALERIRARAESYGVASRVHWEGSYTTLTDDEGRLVDPAWTKIFDLLGRARLAPDPWPLAGGATRVEAYAAGAPTAHMGIRTDPASWGRPQHMVTADHFALEIPRATAYTPADYQEICRRNLYDESFAEAVAAEQAELVSRVSDPRAFWQQLLDRHEDWLRRRRTDVRMTA